MNQGDLMWMDNDDKVVRIGDRREYYKAEVGGMYFRITKYHGGGWLAAWGLVGIGRAVSITMHATKHDAADSCIEIIERRIAKMIGELT